MGRSHAGTAREEDFGGRPSNRPKAHPNLDCLRIEPQRTARTARGEAAEAATNHPAPQIKNDAAMSICRQDSYEENACSFTRDSAVEGSPRRRRVRKDYDPCGICLESAKRGPVHHISGLLDVIAASRMAETFELDASGDDFEGRVIC